MQSWMYYKSPKAFALPVYKCNTHSHYVHLQDGKFEAFPFNFNFFTSHCKQNKNIKAEENQLDKYYCEF